MQINDLYLQQQCINLASFNASSPHMLWGGGGKERELL